MSFLIFILVLNFYLSKQTVHCVTKPNIVFILADDLGWNDVGFHGSNQIPTPNIDALAYTGVILNNYYVTPLCTPSRSALMTGKYPIHTGMQHSVLYGDQPWGLPLEEQLLPQYLAQDGYKSRMVGKWHLGHFKSQYLPENRGFSSHYGYWLGHQDYYDHTSEENVDYWGYDMRRGMNVTKEDYGKYTTDLFTNEAVKIITDHDKSKPLFLYVAHLATHSANSFEPLQAPRDLIKKFNLIEDLDRKIFAAMVTKLDESIGKITSALSKRNMLENSIIIFSTDNGGPAAGFNSNAASNWPLRGVKDTLWEGGVRGASFVWSPMLFDNRGVNNDLFHITDWLPTLYRGVASGNLTDSGIDGYDMWSTLQNKTKSPRTNVLLNIDPKRRFAGVRSGRWKFIKGSTYDHKWDGRYGPSGRDDKYIYNYNQVNQSLAGVSVQKLIPLPDPGEIDRIRQLAAVDCGNELNNREQDEDDVYLYDLSRDPCEIHNLVQLEPSVKQEMEQMIAEYTKTMVPPRNEPADPRSNPKYWDYTWVNWMDYVKSSENIFVSNL